jgi:acetyl esterase/lipase
MLQLSQHDAGIIVMSAARARRVTLLLAAFALQAQAAPQFAPAVAFGARPSVSYLSLSPDGKRVAYIIPTTGQGAALYTNVGVDQSRRMAQRLKAAGASCELVTWENLDHYLDDSAARTQMLSKSDAFLRQADIADAALLISCPCDVDT